MAFMRASNRLFAHAITSLGVRRGRGPCQSAIGGPSFTDGEHSLLIFIVTVSISQSSQERPDILLKEKFLFFAINENPRWLYVLAIKPGSSSHFRPRSLTEGNSVIKAIR
jgi:hypothetical protein